MVYAACTLIFVVASVLIGLVHVRRAREQRKPVTLETLFAGFRYIRSSPILLGAISLDLFAVLLGGVTALLPIYARDILEAGPWALGLLRSAPAVGRAGRRRSCSRATRSTRRAGAIMFAAVGMFGLATLLFGLSTSIVLSFLALAVYGASDAVSVVIRQSLIQLRTPYDMLGRVMAVNALCTGSSGTLGEFRAGVAAAWLGAVPAALMGGFGAIVVMVIWMWAFPQLRRVDKLAPEALERRARSMADAHRCDRPRRSDLRLQAVAARARRGSSGCGPTRSTGSIGRHQGRTPYDAHHPRAAVVSPDDHADATLRHRSSARGRAAAVDRVELVEKHARAGGPATRTTAPSCASCTGAWRLGCAGRVRARLAGAALLAGPVVFVVVSFGLAALTLRALQIGAWAAAAFVGGFLALFMWQSGNYFRRNRPGRYRPEAPPEWLVPPG